MLNFARVSYSIKKSCFYTCVRASVKGVYFCIAFIGLFCRYIFPEIFYFYTSLLFVMRMLHSCQMTAYPISIFTLGSLYFIFIALHLPQTNLILVVCICLGTNVSWHFPRFTLASDSIYKAESSLALQINFALCKVKSISHKILPLVIIHNTMNLVFSQSYLLPSNFTWNSFIM